MSNNSPAGLFIFLGIIGIGLFIATRHNSHAKPHTSTNWELVSPGLNTISRHNESKTNVMMENEERTEYIRGEDGLIKEKIVHRKVIQYG